MKKNLFITNLGLKLASLVLAVLLWFFVIISGRTEIALDVPVTYVNVPAQLEILESPKTVSVNIEGQERILKNLKQREVSAVVDLTEAKAGKSFFSLTSDNITLPRTLEVTDIDPQTISLVMEEQLKKSVSVKPVIVGSPEKGFAIIEIKVDPLRIILEGPQSAISNMETIETEPIDITGVNKNVHYKAKLNLADESVKANIQKVDVDIAVQVIQ